MDDNTIGVDLKDNVFLQIYCNIEQAYELKEFFTCFTVGYKFHPAFKNHAWDGKISFFDIQDYTLPIGLLKRLKPFLIRYGYKIEIMYDRKFLKNEITKEDLIPFYKALFDGMDIYPREYQQEAIYSAIKHKRGVILSPTGSGKSLLIYCLIRFMMADTDKKILLVVPSINLVSQMYSDITDDYGWDAYDDVSLLGGGKKRYDPDKKVLISTWQSIHKKPQSFFDDFDGVLVDECHGTKSISINRILSKCTNAEYKLGLTGTLPTETVDLYNIYGYLGPVIYKLKSNVLIDKGFLSKIKIVNLFVRYTDKEIQINKKRKYAEEVDFIINNEKRNKVLKYILSNKHVHDTDNLLVLATRLSHIDLICEYLEENYPNREILRIDGKTKTEERERVRHYVESNDGIILVATYGTLSTGVNIPKLHHVVFASFYKSKIKVLQSIGRGLRLHESKSGVIIWDIVDDMHWKKRKKKPTDKQKYGYNYAVQHFKERLSFYKEQGFKYINGKVKLEDL